MSEERADLQGCGARRREWRMAVEGGGGCKGLVLMGGRGGSEDLNGD